MLRRLLLGFALNAGIIGSALALHSVPPVPAPPKATPPVVSAPETPVPPEPRKAAIDAQAMIDATLKKIDKDIKREGNIWQFDIGKRQVLVITDPRAERVRIMVPIVAANSLNREMLTRLMQANFDSALDARYAIAQDLLWGTFIHPLTSLGEKDFTSGLAQALAVAENFGTSYSSGAVIFGGGDSGVIQADQLLELLKQKAKNEKDRVI